jgi:DNA-binding HxlR family transcriptional regulator
MMTTGAPDGDGVPDDVRALLRERISSYEQLEILLALQNEPAGRTGEELSSHLRIPSSLVASTLAELQARGLVQRQSLAPEAHYVYMPASPALGAAVAHLARLYVERPVTIMKIMSSNAIQRVRTGAVRAFADAFILRKDKDNG